MASSLFTLGFVLFSLPIFLQHEGRWHVLLNPSCYLVSIHTLCDTARALSAEERAIHCVAVVVLVSLPLLPLPISKPLPHTLHFNDLDICYQWSFSARGTRNQGFWQCQKFKCDSRSLGIILRVWTQYCDVGAIKWTPCSILQAHSIIRTQGNGTRRQNPCNFGGPSYFHLSFKIFVDLAFEFLFDSKIFGGGTVV